MLWRMCAPIILYGYILIKSQAHLLLAANCKARCKLCRHW